MLREATLENSITLVRSSALPEHTYEQCPTNVKDIAYAAWQ